MPAADAVPLVRLLTAACIGPTVTDPGTAAAYGDHLRAAAGHRFMRPALRRPTRLLADAAARAAADGDPWTLTPAG